jgi:hypothetical protein
MTTPAPTGSRMTHADPNAHATSAGRHMQICPSWMSSAEFEICRDDPYRAFDAAQNRISDLHQRVTVAQKLNESQLQDPQYQYGKAAGNFERLKNDHIRLNDEYNDLEAVNETLQEVIEVLRGDKHQLLVELNAIKRDMTIQSVENDQLEAKSRHVDAYNDSLDLKLRAQEAQMANLNDEIKESSTLSVKLTDEIAALQATCQNLSMQSTSLSDLRQHLETTRVAQDRAIQALEREVQGKVQEIVQHDTQLWEFKREMTGRILALQKKAQECNDEMSRLQRLSDHEMATLASQNRALNDELKATADALFATRTERTDFSNAAKKEINWRREEIQQCLSVIDLVERQNQGLESSIARTVEQNKLSEKQILEKDTINNKNLIEQSNFMSMLHMELQTTREDLFLLKARLCHHCRENILADELAEDRAFAAQQQSQVQQQQPTMVASPGGTLSAAVGQPGSAIGALQFDDSGLPVVPAAGAASQMETGDKHRLEGELRQTREALDAMNRQLLDERAQRERERLDEESMRTAEDQERAARQVDDDARRNRVREDERKVQSGQDSQTFTIRFMDDSRKKIDAFLSDTIGEVINRVCAKIGVRAVDFFHLAHRVNENSVLGAVDRFLDKHRTLEQESISPKHNLIFKFKHYKRHVAWNDTVAQEWFFRQLHHTVVAEYYPVHEKLAVQLASCEIQAVFGDFSGKKRHSYFDRVGLDSYLPASVSAHNYEYWQERLFALHKQRKGLSTVEARKGYIDEFANFSPYWGLTFFDVRDKENHPFLAGIGEDGLFIFSPTKTDCLTMLPFNQLLNWERSATGMFVKKKGSAKMTLFASSKLQSKEMCDLLNEYYMMLPQQIRDGLKITIDGAEELRARLPPPELFYGLRERAKPMDFSSQLEFLKSAYMEHCLEPSEAGLRSQPLLKLTQMIDTAIDENRTLEDLDLSNCDPPLDDRQFAVIKDLLDHTMENDMADTTHYKLNIDLRKFSIAHPKDQQMLREQCVTNVCSFLRHYRRLTHVDLSYVPLDNRNEADVGAALVQLKDLEELTLRGCKISPKGFTHIVQVFTNTPSRLTTLNLEHNNLSTNCLPNICAVLESDACSLTNLNIGFNRIPNLERLVDTLKKLNTSGAPGKSRLLALDVSGNPGGDTAISDFAHLMNVGLTEINISSNGIGGEIGVKIMNELKNKKTMIAKLNLSGNPIGKTLARQFQHASGEVTRDIPVEFFAFLDVTANSHVRELVMDSCEMHDEVGLALATVLF